MARKLGRLYNGQGELIAEGPCELNPSAGGAVQVTMWPTAERALFDRQRGLLALYLEDGGPLWISDRRLKLKVSPPGGVPASLYRMQVLEEPAADKEAYQTLRAETSASSVEPPQGEALN